MRVSPLATSVVNYRLPFGCGWPASVFRCGWAPTVSRSSRCPRPARFARPPLWRWPFLRLRTPSSHRPIPTPWSRPALTAPPFVGGSPRHLQGLPQPVYVDRVRWYTRQEHQLNLMIRDLAAVLEHVTTTPVERWDDRWGYRLEQLTDAMTDKYAFGSPDLWPLASRNIVCGTSLDLAMTSGIGSGCPSEDFVAVVDAVYVASGEIVSRLNRVGKAAQLPYDNVSGNLFQGTEVSQYQAGALADIERLMAQIETFFEEIHRQGEAHGHYLDVRLP